MKADVLTIPKMWYFLRFEGFEPEVLAVKDESNFKKINLGQGMSKKNDARSKKF